MLQGPPEQKPVIMLEKRERGRIQGLHNVFWIPPIISGTGKATNFKFCTDIHMIDRNKRPFKILEKRERGRTQGLSKIFMEPIYMVHRAVLPAIAQHLVFICNGFGEISRICHIYRSLTSQTFSTRPLHYSRPTTGIIHRILIIMHISLT